MTVLASGSKGNSAVIASSRTRILVDAGLSCRELLRRMAQVGEDPAALSAILITHEHQDHVAGLAVLARRLNIPVFFTEGTHRAWVRMLTPRRTMSYAEWLDHVQKEKEERAAAAATAGANLPAHLVLSASATAVAEPAIEISGEADPAFALPVDPDEALAAEESCEPAATRESAKADPTFLPAVEYFRAGHEFSIGDIDINPFTIPHDAADPCGFVFHARSESMRMAIATDLGYIPPNVKQALKNVDVLLLESNHDLEMLKDGPYPWGICRTRRRRSSCCATTTAAHTPSCWGIFRSRTTCRSWRASRRSRLWATGCGCSATG
jgi:phosphoribosyl 1,2-cyclic phosphodiesterase